MTKIDKHELGAPSWFDLMSPDVAKAQAFYAGLFGSSGGAEYGGYTMAQCQPPA